MATEKTQIKAIVSVVPQEEDVILAAATIDYDVFSFDPANRPVDRKRVERLKEAIRKHNLLRSFPIVISTEDGKWVVRDGQHRLTAARELGVSIYYTFNDEMTQQDVIDVGGNTKPHSAHDRLHMYCVQGRPEYIKLQAFCDRYPWMPISVAINLCHYGDRASMGFEKGEYLCNDLEFAEEVIHGVLQMARFFSFWKERVFVLAVAQLFEHEGYRHERMLAKLEFQQNKAVKCVDTPSYMRLFDEIYNYKSKENDRFQLRVLNAGSKARRVERRYRNARERK